VVAQVYLSFDDVMQHGRVRRRARESHGNLSGQVNSPIHDTRVHEVELGDGTFANFAANVIAECMHNVMLKEMMAMLRDAKGKLHVLLDAIVDYNSDDSAVLDDDRFMKVNGRHHVKKATRGWKLCVRWKDDSTFWETLLISRSPSSSKWLNILLLENEPPFAWWVPFIFEKEELNYCCSEQVLYQEDSQVWDRGTQDH